ncbi:MAG: hypothetical protein MJZ09_07600 [Bacteroidales bacterium]|nr:hypothetical protein [Bacteroidales bacterium]
MKRFFIALTAATLIMSCSKNSVEASYKFIDENIVSSKAIASNGGMTTCWENGDKVDLTVRLHRKDEGKYLWDDGKLQMEAQLVYENGAWTIFETPASAPRKVEYLTISLPSADYNVTFDYYFSMPNIRYIHWHRTIEFREGVQEIPVQLPMTENQ